MGGGAITSLSRKQGMNTRSYIEAEVVVVPNDMKMVISQGTRLSSQREYPLSRYQKYHLAQDQWMQECWQVLLSSEHRILPCC